MVVERVNRGACEQTRLTHCTAEHLAEASRAGDELCTTSKSAANRRAEAFEKQMETLSTRAVKAVGATPSATHAFIRRAPSMCT